MRGFTGWVEGEGSFAREVLGVEGARFFATLRMTGSYAPQNGIIVS